jgi:hypothetical protein
MDFIRESGKSVLLAGRDRRLAAAASALGVPFDPAVIAEPPALIRAGGGPMFDLA